MSYSQLWLFSPPRPLQDRLGVEFFRSVPAQPGVYVMSGRLPGEPESRILYVGKSVNLRRRLADYCRARPGREPRKTVRLVHLVERITWETCVDGQEALLRENELLRRLRPRFNRAKNWPWGYWYMGWRGDGRLLELSLAHEPVAGWHWHGAFKGAQAFGALARLLHSALGRPEHPVGAPPGCWFSLALPRRVSFALSPLAPPDEAGALAASVNDFLAGTSDRLVAWLEGRLRGRGGPGDVAGFDTAWQAADLEALRQFFSHGPRRNLGLREQLRVEEGLIRREELDDLLVLMGDPSARSAPASRELPGTLGLQVA